VGPIQAQPDLSDRGERLRRERLVELDEVYVLEREPGEPQDFRDGDHRSSMYTAGLVSTSLGFGEKSGFSRVEDMCSVPPATTAVAKPLVIRSAAEAMVCSPE
jgi:hypothetical protein